MKKALSLAIVIVLTAAMLAAFTGCAAKNIEAYSARGTITYWISKYEAVYLDFKDGVLTVNYNVYDKNDANPSGKQKNNAKSSTVEYFYELDGNDCITVNGESYRYSMTKDGDSGMKFHFNKPFLGIAAIWN